MTALSLIVQAKRRAAYLIADAAWTDAAGRVNCLGSKLIQLARFPAVVGMQGNVHLPNLGEELHRSDPRNLATLVKVLPSCLRRAIERTEVECVDAVPGQTLAILKVAAWSSRQQRAIGYVLTSDPALATAMGGTEWTVHEATSSLSASACPTHLFAGLRDCEDPALFVPEAQAFALVEHERRTPQLLMTSGASESAPYRIGGGVQLAKVTRKGVQITPCGEWPDRVGQLIDPSADHVIAHVGR